MHAGRLLTTRNPIGVGGPGAQTPRPSTEEALPGNRERLLRCALAT